MIAVSKGSLFRAFTPQQLQLGAMRLGNAGLQFLIGLLAVRELGVAGAGQMFAVHSVWVLGRTVGTYGSYWLILRGAARPAPRRSFPLWFFAARRVTAINLVLAISATCGAIIFNKGLIFLVECAAVGFSLCAIGMINAATFNSRRMPAFAFLFDLCAIPASQLIPLLVGLRVPVGHHVSAILTGQILLLCSFLALHSFPLLKAARPGDLTASSKYGPRDIAASFRLWLADAGINLALKTPILLVALMGGATAGAEFNIAQQFGTAGGILTWSAMTAQHKQLSDALKKSDPKVIRHLQWRIAAGPTVVNGLYAIILSMFGVAALERLYGFRGSDIWLATTALAIMTVVESVFGIGIAALNLSNREGLSAAYNVGMCALLPIVFFVFSFLGFSPVPAGGLALSVCWTSRAVLSWNSGLSVFGWGGRSRRLREKSMATSNGRASDRPLDL